MTENELKEACEKFIAYLNANGARVLAFGIGIEHRNGMRAYIAGNGEMTDELAIRALASSRSLKINE